MKISKEELRKRDIFFLVEPKELEQFEEWAEYLESILNGRCSLFEINGKEELTYIKVFVANVRGIKIEIYPKEHAPPHFHVNSSKVDASIKIDDCSLLNGNISSMDLKKIKYWHSKGARELLIEIWNSTRPSICTVGKFKD